MSARDINNIKDHLICAICLDSVSDPRKLPCHHSFCLLCLTKHISEARKSSRGIFRSKQFQSFKCPSCRNIIEVENAKLNDEEIAKRFPANVLLADIEKRVKLHESNVPSCERHAEIPAEYFCKFDDAFLCIGCAVNTHRSESCTILSLEEANVILRSEYKSIKQQYKEELKRINNMLTMEYKGKLSEKIKLTTLTDINVYEKQIGKFYQKALQDIEDLKEKMDVSSCIGHVDTHDSQIRGVMHSIERRKKALDDMKKDGDFLLKMQKFKRKNESFITNVRQKIPTFSESIFVRNAKVNEMIKDKPSIGKFNIKLTSLAVDRRSANPVLKNAERRRLENCEHDTEEDDSNDNENFEFVFSD